MGARSNEGKSSEVVADGSNFMPAWVTSPVHRSIVSALVAARNEAGLTQRDVAARLSKPPSFVGKVEAIERNLSASELVEWAKVVGADPATLLTAALRY